MTSWKRWTAAVALGLCLAAGFFTTPAEAATPERPDVYVDGEWIRFDVQPQVYQYRTLVPMRMIFEALGADVRWEDATQTAVATKNGTTLRLPIGSSVVTKNGQPVQLDVPAQLVSNRTMVPVRFLAESFGDDVQWEEAQGRVTITSAQAGQVRVVGDDSYHLTDGMTAGVQHLVQSQNLAALVENEIGKKFQKPVWIYLANSQEAFQQGIQKYGEDPDAASVADVAEGVTYGSRVLIPLNKLQGDRERTQTIAHELMHVLLNQNGGRDLPSWVHEGLAWQAGLDAEFQNQPPVMRRQVDGMLRDYVLGVVNQGKYQPLVGASEGTVDALQTAGYNVELQDYLAYKYMTATYGKPKLLDYINKYTGGLRTTAFQQAVGVSLPTFEANFKAYLQAEIKRTSNGMEITLNVPSTFRGSIHLLPQGTGTTATQALTLPPGQHKLRVYKDGRIEGAPARAERDKAERDAGTVYLFVDVDQARKEQGVQTSSGGLGFYDSYGESYFGYAWLNTSQDAVYPETNQLFGVEILDVQAF
jgi:hypothetical protein